jgi:hypothetical protein
MLKSWNQVQLGIWFTGLDVCNSTFIRGNTATDAGILVCTYKTVREQYFACDIITM